MAIALALRGADNRALGSVVPAAESRAVWRGRMSRESDASQQARDLKRSALAVAMVLLKELDEAVPETHGARAVAALMLQQRQSNDAASVDGGPAEMQVDAVLLAMTGAVGRLLDAADDKCPEGPLKPMLLFRIVEELAKEGYDLDDILDFVRRAHAGGPREDAPAAAQARTKDGARPLRWAS